MPPSPRRRAGRACLSSTASPRRLHGRTRSQQQQSPQLFRPRSGRGDMPSQKGRGASQVQAFRLSNSRHRRDERRPAVEASDSRAIGDRPVTPSARVHAEPRRRGSALAAVPVPGCVVETRTFCPRFLGSAREGCPRHGGGDRLAWMPRRKAGRRGEARRGGGQRRRGGGVSWPRRPPRLLARVPDLTCSLLQANRSDRPGGRTAKGADLPARRPSRRRARPFASARPDG